MYSLAADIAADIAAAARRRPSWVWALVAMFAAGGVRLSVSAFAPMSDLAPARYGVWLGITLLCVAAVVFALWQVIGRAGQVALPLVANGFVSMMVTTADTRAGLAMTAFAYLWPALYVGYFVTRWVVHVNAGLVAVGYGAALAHSGEPRMLACWIIVVGTVWLAGYMLAHLVGRLRAQALIDDLTGLANRGALIAAGHAAVVVAHRTGAALSIAVLDIDDLKLVNDQRGHAAGDRLLRGVATAWREHVRRGDLLARIGGDEFVVVLPGTNQTEAIGVVARFAAAVDVPFSVGVAQLGPADTLGSLHGRADAAMYEDKRRRREASGRPARYDA